MQRLVLGCTMIAGRVVVASCALREAFTLHITAAVNRGRVGVESVAVQVGGELRCFGFSLLLLAFAAASASEAQEQFEPTWSVSEFYSSEFRFTEILEARVYPAYNIWAGDVESFELAQYSLSLVATPGIEQGMNNWTPVVLLGEAYYTYSEWVSETGPGYWDLPDEILLSDALGGQIPAGHTDEVTTYRLEARMTYSDDTAQVDWPSGTTSSWGEFRITHAVPHVRGDYNHDGLVDAADYTVWRDAVGSSNRAADGDGNGTVWLEDYQVFSQNYGLNADANAAVSTPEPTSGIMSVLALILPLLKSRSR